MNRVRGNWMRLGQLALCGGILMTGVAVSISVAEEAPKRGEGRQLRGPQAEGERPAGRGGFDGSRQRGGQGEMNPGQRIDQMLADLNLTDDQKAKVAAIHAEARKEHTAWREKNAEAMKQLREETQAAREAKDEAKLKALGEKRRELMQGGPERGKIMQQIHEVLTPEQREQLKKKIAEARPAQREGGPAAGERRQRGQGGEGARPQRGEGGEQRQRPNRGQQQGGGKIEM